MRKRGVLFLLILCLFGCAACQFGSVAHEAGSVSLLVTRDYGANLITESEVPLVTTISVLENLQAIFPDEVVTAYGGGLVQEIAGWSSVSGQPNQDWFFFVNGLAADVGARDYLLTAGEQIWWDYRPWQTWQGINAVIGSYPEPFLHGYGGQVGETVLSYSTSAKALALELALALEAQGVLEVKTEALATLNLAQRNGPTLVVGEWSALRQNSYLADLNQAFAQNGTFVHFTENGLELLNYKGEKVRELGEGCGVILAFAEMAGAVNPLWLVSGTDEQGVAQAVSLFFEEPVPFLGYGGVVIQDGEFWPLPLE